MELETLLTILGGIALAAVVLGALVLWWVLRRMRKLRVPPGADFFTTVRAVPFALVLGLDLLDLGLDVLSAPVIWIILSRFNLQALRNVATIEALIPVTGPIPTLSLAWIAARVFNLGEPPDPTLIETVKVAPGRYAARRP